MSEVGTIAPVLFSGHGIPGVVAIKIIFGCVFAIIVISGLLVMKRKDGGK